MCDFLVGIYWPDKLLRNMMDHTIGVLPASLCSLQALIVCPWMFCAPALPCLPNSPEAVCTSTHAVAGCRNLPARTLMRRSLFFSFCAGDRCAAMEMLIKQPTQTAPTARLQEQEKMFGFGYPGR